MFWRRVMAAPTDGARRRIHMPERAEPPPQLAPPDIRIVSSARPSDKKEFDIMPKAPRRPMAIQDFKIKDEASFKAAGQDPRQIALLYFLWQLEPLIDLAYAISNDFFDRPHLYTKIADKTLPPLIAHLSASYGKDEKTLDAEQRSAVFAPFFGAQASGSSGNAFSRLSHELTQAAAAYVERAHDTGLEMLRERVRASHRALKEELTTAQGTSLEWSAGARTTQALEAYGALREGGISVVFGIPTAPKAEWPFDDDANGDKLVEEVSKFVTLSEGTAAPAARLGSREQFCNARRAAVRGTEAIATIIEFGDANDDKDLEVLVRKCYQWGTALTALGTTRPAPRADERRPRPVVGTPGAPGMPARA